MTKNDFNSGFSRPDEAGDNLKLPDIDSLTIKQVQEYILRMTPVQYVFTKTYLETRFDIEAAANRAGLTTFEARAFLQLNYNIRIVCLWYMRKNALPEEEILARLSMMARADVGSFLVKKQKPIFNKDGLEIGTNEVWELDIEGMQQKGYSFLIKKIGYDRQGNMQWELHDSMKALQMLARAYGLFDQVNQMQIDWSTLNKSQIERIARGEDPRMVVMTPNQLPSSQSAN